MRIRSENNEPVIIAVCGKGGVGKTSMSALLTLMLLENPVRRVLAIDADPAVGLATALGITVNRTVDDIRTELIARIGTDRSPNPADMMRELDYQLFDSISERENLAFLAIGRPEGEGCYCKVNALLRDIITETAQGFDFVVIDAEAGIEQMNRRVMEPLTHLLLISDISAKARQVAHTIEQVARAITGFQRAGILFNRIADEGEVSRIIPSVSLPVLGVIGDDPMIHAFDRDGRSFFGMQGCAAFDTLKSAMKNFIY